MRAIVYEKYGPPDVLHVRTVDKPVPGDGEIRIRVLAAEVTKADCEMRSLAFQVRWLRLPMRIVLGFTRPRKPVLGGYFSGVVDAVGARVAGFEEGDPVFGAAKLRLGAHAEYLCLPAGYTIVPRPRHISAAAAAAAPLGGLNALHFLGRAGIRRGETVLVNGAGGSIGIFGVQIARAWGATVTAVDGPHKEALLRGIGADHFIDHTRTDFARCGRTYDVILNMVARRPYADCIAALSPGGRYLMANPKLSDMLRSPATHLFSDKRSIAAFAGETRDELITIGRMIDQGQIRPVVDRVYPFEQAADAHRRVEAERRLGAVILSPDRSRVDAGVTPCG